MTEQLLTDLAISIAASAIVALLGWALSQLTRRLKRPLPDPPSQPANSASVASIVNIYLSQTTTNVVNRTTYVRGRSNTPTDDDAIGYIFLTFIITAALSWVWNQYKVPLLIVIGIGTVLGWSSSFYFVTVLRKMSGPLTLLDHALSWGSMLIWATSIPAIVIGVFEPLYAPAASQAEVFLMGAEAFQALGAGALLTATLTTASLQLTAASIYEKALSGDLPNRLEVWLWRRRRGAIAISMLTLGLGLPMVSGLASYYFELFT